MDAKIDGDDDDSDGDDSGGDADADSNDYEDVDDGSGVEEFAPTTIPTAMPTARLRRIHGIDAASLRQPVSMDSNTHTHTDYVLMRLRFLCRSTSPKRPRGHVAECCRTSERQGPACCGMLSE